MKKSTSSILAAIALTGTVGYSQTQSLPAAPVEANSDDTRTNQIEAGTNLQRFLVYEPTSPQATNFDVSLLFHHTDVREGVPYDRFTGQPLVASPYLTQLQESLLNIEVQATLEQQASMRAILATNTPDTNVEAQAATFLYACIEDDKSNLTNVLVRMATVEGLIDTQGNRGLLLGQTEENHRARINLAAAYAANAISRFVSYDQAEIIPYSYTSGSPDRVKDFKAGREIIQQPRPKELDRPFSSIEYPAEQADRSTNALVRYGSSIESPLKACRDSETPPLSGFMAEANVVRGKMALETSNLVQQLRAADRAAKLKGL
jgi:hypothetical protein